MSLKSKKYFSYGSLNIYFCIAQHHMTGWSVNKELERTGKWSQPNFIYVYLETFRELTTLSTLAEIWTQETECNSTVTFSPTFAIGHRKQVSLNWMSYGFNISNICYTWKPSVSCVVGVLCHSTRWLSGPYKSLSSSITRLLKKDENFLFTWEGSNKCIYHIVISK